MGVCIDCLAHIALNTLRSASLIQFALLVISMRAMTSLEGIKGTHSCEMRRMAHVHVL